MDLRKPFVAGANFAASQRVLCAEKRRDPGCDSERATLGCDFWHDKAVILEISILENPVNRSDANPSIVFLFDVDNTLLDNDRVAEDLKRYLTE